jgi:hypothetical protein
MVVASNDRVMMYGVQTFKKQGAKLLPAEVRGTSISITQDGLRLLQRLQS